MEHLITNSERKEEAHIKGEEMVWQIEREALK